MVLSHVQLFEGPWIVAHQAPLPSEFSRQDYRCKVPFLTPGDLPDPGIEPTPLASWALAGRFITTSITWEAQALVKCYSYARHCPEQFADIILLNLSDNQVRKICLKPFVTVKTEARRDPIIYPPHQLASAASGARSNNRFI